MKSPNFVSQTCPHRKRLAVRRRRPAFAMIAALLWAALVASLGVVSMPAKAAEDAVDQIPNGTVLVPYASDWQYWRNTTEPNIAWQFRPGDLGWWTSKAPFGYGTTRAVNTTFANQGSQNPAISYFRHNFEVAALSDLSAGAQLTVIADDGASVYVNGREIGRINLPDYGFPGLSWARANMADAEHAPDAANAQPVTLNIPSAYLVQGTNVISVALVSSFKSTPNIYFDAKLTAGNGGAAPAVGRPNPNLTLQWSDEFDGTAVNTANWRVLDDSTYGTGGRQQACLYDDNVTVGGGYLVITAKKLSEPVICEGKTEPDFPGGRLYSSGHMESNGKRSFTYGRIEIRAKLPVAQDTSKGMWPAFWMRPVSGPDGEIDIIEALGSNPTDDWQAGVVHQTVHGSYDAKVQNGYNYLMPNGVSMANNFHTYAMEWTATDIKFFVDGVLTRTINSSNFPDYNTLFVNRAYYMRLNMAVGGTWPGNVEDSTVFPASFEVDYVRLYQ